MKRNQMTHVLKEDEYIRLHVQCVVGLDLGKKISVEIFLKHDKNPIFGFIFLLLPFLCIPIYRL